MQAINDGATGALNLTCTIHKCCRALAGSFVPACAMRADRRTESLVPQGILSCAIPQGTLSAASGIHLGAIHLIGRPYAWLRPPSSEYVANKCPACLRTARTGRRNHHGDS